LAKFVTIIGFLLLAPRGARSPMSALCQQRKGSQRANVVRHAPESGHRSALLACPLSARLGHWSTIRSSGRLWMSYVTFVFQKIGAPNLRTPWTFLRKAVGCTHSPHGT